MTDMLDDMTAGAQIFHGECARVLCEGDEENCSGARDLTIEALRKMCATIAATNGCRENDVRFHFVKLLDSKGITRIDEIKLVFYSMPLREPSLSFIKGHSIRVKVPQWIVDNLSATDSKSAQAASTALQQSASRELKTDSDTIINPPRDTQPCVTPPEVAPPRRQRKTTKKSSPSARPLRGSPAKSLLHLR
ncbi:MAG: hypothetical protein M0R33_18860 [Methylomonas sp.]|jgi:hypothetical protein|uniref:hypothetical protein n=1 Tax=Methylomonas sp. TaxID=418 RepID=UPI0025FE46F8|nr:hypothetical protein [Methylomonas sp.]MCK9608506.1 hypothetical protein [Methylomonas sp.]